MATQKKSEVSKEMKDSEFHQFFVDELKDIYWAETHLVKALPKIKKAATSKELAKAFDKHLGETEKHVETLEKVFELLDEKASAKKCDAMAGLLEEADSIIEDTDKGTMVRDAGLILAAQKVEHYEIATYGTLAAYAKILQESEALKILLQTLEEEKKCDELLTQLADTNLNSKAAKEK